MDQYYILIIYIYNNIINKNQLLPLNIPILGINQCKINITNYWNRSIVYNYYNNNNKLIYCDYNNNINYFKYRDIYLSDNSSKIIKYIDYNNMSIKYNTLENAKKKILHPLMIKKYNKIKLFKDIQNKIYNNNKILFLLDNTSEYLHFNIKNLFNTITIQYHLVLIYSLINYTFLI